VKMVHGVKNGMILGNAGALLGLLVRPAAKVGQILDQ
jgi:hypothetical protein